MLLLSTDSDKSLKSNTDVLPDDFIFNDEIKFGDETTTSGWIGLLKPQKQSLKRWH